MGGSLRVVANCHVLTVWGNLLTVSSITTVFMSSMLHFSFSLSLSPNNRLLEIYYDCAAKRIERKP